MIVLGESSFWFRFPSIIQFFTLWSMDDKAEAEPKTALAKYYLLPWAGNHFLRCPSKYFRCWSSNWEIEYADNLFLTVTQFSGVVLGTFTGKVGSKRCDLTGSSILALHSHTWIVHCKMSKRILSLIDKEHQFRLKLHIRRLQNSLKLHATNHPFWCNYLLDKLPLRYKCWSKTKRLKK